MSFEEFAPVWPSMDEFATYNALPKFVVSTSLTQDAVTASGWAYSHLLTTLDDVRKLRDGAHGDGSRFSDVTDGPVDDGIKTRLTLVESQQFANGINLAVFDVAR